MPITKELKNLKKLEAVGFSHEQAETLADIIEESHVDGQQSLKEFITDKFDSFSKEIRNELKLSTSELRQEMSKIEAGLKTSISETEAKLRASQSDLLIKYSAIIAGFISIALATAKLLW